MPNKRILLRGVAASRGTAQGTAKRFLPTDDASGFAEGDILVTTITDPTMVQAMVKAAAIVTDHGGITSHPAILSREMGIPCVVNTKTATQDVRDGMRLEVDGTNGIVYVLD